MLSVDKVVMLLPISIGDDFQLGYAGFGGECDP